MAVPRISIIIPQLGREDGLKRCLESIKRIIYPQASIEVLVIEGPETVPNKVKHGFEQSTGEWIVFGANDIEFEPLSIQLALHDANVHNKRLIAFDTGVRNDEGWICEHFMIHCSLVYEIGGEIFDTEFYHVGVDDLLWYKCDKLGEAMISRGKVIHHHFSRIGSGVEMDEVYKKGWERAEHDRNLLRDKLRALGISKSL